jgi:signal transduction histidine kinase
MRAVACETGAVNREEIARRWQAAVAWLRRSTGQPPRLTPWGWAADAILALTLTIGAVNGAQQFQDGPGAAVPQLPVFLPSGTPIPPMPPFELPHATGTQLALAALTALPLVARRRFPLASFWIIAVATGLVYDQLSGADLTWTVVASVVAAYSAPAFSRYRNLALVSVVVAAVWVFGRKGDGLPGVSSGLVVFLLLSSVGLAANTIHTWRQRAQTLQREQAAATQLAVDHERARLARELHDVVGHNVSVMVVQAGAARKVMDTTPELAREALLAVEAGGRAAMTELRQVIGLLTGDGDGAELAPLPGLDALPELAARVRETGTPVTLTVTGPVDSLPPGVDLAAYRVVQEALTNAVKHAAGAPVSIVVSGTADELRVEITDTGGDPSAGSPGPSSGSGRGLAGLRERLAMYGGTLTAGRRPTGGYRVVAALPLREAA